MPQKANRRNEESADWWSRTNMSCEGWERGPESNQRRCVYSVRYVLSNVWQLSVERWRIEPNETICFCLFSQQQCDEKRARVFVLKWTHARGEEWEQNGENENCILYWDLLSIFLVLCRQQTNKHSSYNNLERCCYLDFILVPLFGTSVILNVKLLHLCVCFFAQITILIFDSLLNMTNTC